MLFDVCWQYGYRPRDYYAMPDWTEYQQRYITSAHTYVAYSSTVVFSTHPPRHRTEEQLAQYNALYSRVATELELELD